MDRFQKFPGAECYRSTSRVGWEWRMRSSYHPNGSVGPLMREVSHHPAQEVTNTPSQQLSRPQSIPTTCKVYVLGHVEGVLVPGVLF